MFEKASRLQMRFVSPNGALSVEDLWAIPLSGRSDRANLDDIAKEVYKNLQSTQEVSFVHKDVKKEKEVSVLTLQLDILKHVIGIRQAEAEALQRADEKRAKKQKILEAIANAEDKELHSKSLEELKAMAEAM